MEEQEEEQEMTTTSNQRTSIKPKANQQKQMVEMEVGRVKCAKKLIV